MKSTTLILNDNIQESEDTILWLLHNKNLNNEQKEAIIEHEETILDDITKIQEKELYSIIIKHNKIKPTWDNLLYFYISNENNITIELIQYLNIEKNYKELSKLKINNKEDFNEIEVIQTFNRKIMLCNEINDESYRYLIKSIWYKSYPELDIENLNYDKVLYMLEANKFKFNFQNFQNLKNNFELQIKFIEKNYNSLIDIFEELELEIDTSDIIEILESKIINSKIKKELIEKMNYELITNTEIASLIYKLKDKNMTSSIYYINNMVNSLGSIENRINIIVTENQCFNN